MTAAALAGRVAAHETPAAVVQARLALAAQVAAELDRDEAVVAALVVGSTALRRCSVRADLDLVIVTDGGSGRDAFESRVVDGVRVEIERVDRAAALATTTGGGWIWELRQAARLGGGVPVLDHDGFAPHLARRAAAMHPWADRFEATLRDVYLLLVDLGRGPGDRATRMDALRGCLDNLALLALLERPRRYQKAKWALADLLHAGEVGLVDAVLAAYGLRSDDAASAQDAVAGVRDLVERAYARLGLPSHQEILDLGHTPTYAQAGYVSRCLDDADDLEASGRFVEAQYVAKFAARLTAGLLGPPAAGGGVIETFTTQDGDDLARRYLALFDGVTEEEPLAAALAAADARRDGLAARAVACDPALRA